MPVPLCWGIRFDTLSSIVNRSPLIQRRVALQSEHRRPAQAAHIDGVRELLRESLQTSQSSINDAYQNGAHFLRSQGFLDQEEVNRVLDIAMNPNSLHRSFRERKRSNVSSARTLTVESDIKPVLEFLASKGLSQRQIVKVVSGHPPVLSYNLDKRLRPFFAAMVEAGIADPAKAVVQRPTLLGLEPDQGLRKIVEYLKETGHSPESIAELLATSI